MDNYNDLDDTIKDSFEINSSKPPDNLWSKISEKLDFELNQSKLENKIKESYENSKTELKTDLWNNISQKLPNKISENKLDKTIKDSFENANNKAPEFIWKNIRKQLDIDKVWENINSELNRVRFRKFANIAAIILILIFVDIKILNNYSYDHLNGELDGENSAENNLTEIVELNLENNFAENKNTDLQLNNENSNSGNQGNEVSENNNISDNLNNSESDFSITNSDNQTIVLQLQENHQNNSFINQDFYAENDTISETNINNLPKSDEKLQEIESIAVFLIDSSLNELDLIVENNLKKQINSEIITEKFSDKIEIGFVLDYSNTWLINNETKASLSPNSLIISNLNFAGGYGFLTNYNFNKSNALVAEIDINSKTIQSYGLYISGNFENKNMEFNYTKLSISYKYRTNSFSDFMKFRYNYKTGVYCSNLRNYEVEYSDENILSTETYESFDYGLKFSTGFENNIRNFVFSYGINFNLGLHNIFAGSSYQRSNFNTTKNYSQGVYFSVLYKI